MAGLGESCCKKSNSGSKKNDGFRISDGLEFAEKREEVFHITTGSKNLIIFWEEEELKQKQ